MIRAIANKRLDLSDDEMSYFALLKEKFGERSFKSLFETNKDGIITGIMPSLNEPTPLPVIFFMFNVMINQRIRFMDTKLGALDKDKKLMDLEARLAILEERMGSGARPAGSGK